MDEDHVLSGYVCKRMIPKSYMHLLLQYLIHDFLDV